MTKIAYLTDTHLDEPAPRRHGADTRSNFEKVAAAIDELQPDLVIFGGDMGTADSHRYFFDRFKTEVLVVAGNHDFPFLRHESRRALTYISGFFDRCRIGCAIGLFGATDF
jgi:predicted phosphodiesterase